MNDFIRLTYYNIQRIIEYASKEGRKGNYIYEFIIIQPQLATQGIDSSFAFESGCLASGSSSEPIPKIRVV